VAAAVPISTTTVKIAEVSPASQVTAAAPVTLTRSASPAATTSTSSSSKNVGSGFGLSYSPYKTNGECKTQEEVIKDFESISGYSLIRIYGTDCNQVAKMLTVCKSKGLKLFAGVFNIANVAVEIATIVTAAGGDWSHFDTISIGNEVVNSGTASASAVVAAIGAARALLKVAGYPGRVVTVDTLIAARANPSLCDASDYCAVNCHPFFDGTYAAAESGKFLSDMIPTLSAKLANKNQEIVIAETGWPWKGDTNQKAVPSLENQAAALASIRSTFASSPGSVILFSAYNDLWKTSNAFQFGAEQYWGMGGITSPTS
jgi:exo-beta-1,3-glucanase (GH17 family)